MTDFEQTQAIIALTVLVAVMSAVVGAPMALHSYARDLKRHMIAPARPKQASSATG